jgi:hypothetical protein
LLVARGEREARGGGGQEEMTVRHGGETRDKLRRSENDVDSMTGRT